MHGSGTGVRRWRRPRPDAQRPRRLRRGGFFAEGEQEPERWRLEPEKATFGLTCGFELWQEPIHA